MAPNVKPAMTSAPTSCTMLPVRVPHVFEPDGHRKPGADLQREFAERAAVAIDVAAVHEMADFEERRQHREQDRGAVDHARTAGRRRACAADGRRPRTRSRARRSRRGSS